jgi:hypothetical protein
MRNYVSKHLWYSDPRMMNQGQDPGPDLFFFLSMIYIVVNIEKK